MILPPTFVAGFHDEAAVRRMKYNRFGATGLLVSHLSIGTSGFCPQYGDYSIDQCKEALHRAIKSGVNFIDTAPLYGHGVSEEVLGKCLEGIPRQAYYLSTKVGRYHPKLMFDFSAGKTRESIELSLKKLGVEYIDLLQVHDIEYDKSLSTVLQETLPVLDEARRTGKAKFIGVTGYSVFTLAECIEKSRVKIDTVLSYCRLSLIDTTLQQYLPDFKARDLGVINAAGLCLGLLTDEGPQPWHPAPQFIKDICVEANEYCKANNVSLARLATHYCYQQSGPDTTLIGMNHVDLVCANLDVLYNGIDSHEQQVLTDVQMRFFSKLKIGNWEQENNKFKETLP
ncbi:L-galactose dehydrogenase-like [Photinus pyralis]|uniref:L-galactose dehydrogenase-like n=1 Tax=Photinus pyralis TaxID=7054 RepID=UPI0012670265|nr:L-galactose dehydrogenase-like [Photinus pyralis]